MVHLLRKFFTFIAVMQYANSALILNILHRDYPDVAVNINRQISQALPAYRLTDYAAISGIVKSFESAAVIAEKHWPQSEFVALSLTGDEQRLCKITEVREILIAVVMLFYQPERLLGLDTGCARRGLLKELAEVIDTNRFLLSHSLSNAITRYRAYKSFKAEVDWLYEQIKRNIAG